MRLAELLEHKCIECKPAHTERRNIDKFLLLTTLVAAYCNKYAGMTVYSYFVGIKYVFLEVCLVLSKIALTSNSN